MDRTRWTHVTPRTADECPGDVAPARDERGFYVGADGTMVTSSRAVCASCKRRVRPMRRNEGPEGLAALLRF